MQRSTPRYHVRRLQTLEANNTHINDNTTKATASAMLSPPTIISKAHDDDGKSQPLIITAWVNNMQLKKTLLDGGSMVELISRALVKTDES